MSLFEPIVGVDCCKFVTVESAKLVENVASKRFPAAAFDLVGVLCTTPDFGFTAYGGTGVVCEIPLGLSPVSPFGSLACST